MNSTSSKLFESAQGKGSNVALAKSSTTLKDIGTPATFIQIPSTEKIDENYTDRRGNDRENLKDYEKNLDSPKFSGRKLFHNFSATTLQRNQRFTSHLVKNYTKSYAAKEM